MNENDLKNLTVTITNGAGVVQSTISLASLGKEYDLGEGQEPTDALPTDLGDAVKEELYSNYYKDNFVRSTHTPKR